ncbi:O-antigen translocase [Morganella morganii]|uniref:O-antigen translocase n=1 Tax=Morganella morganii TaxID=582 RepID=UPI00128C248E|nr:O-antigen translocase [Morganella morganii]MQC08411.1 O-antigen flippase [Morganella morganii]MQC10431.1 O-antigen flippase [Morganella morganii]MQC15843.1 O-antigen flippase [Morganella morganii]
MTLIKTSILSLIATFFKMLSGLVINKAVSVYIGPSGLALIGQFQNFLQIALIAAQGAINNGVVKYSAEYSHDEIKLRELLSTSLKISIVTSLISAAIIVIFSTKLSYFIFSNTDYTYIFILLGVTIFLFTLNSLFLSILNGLKKIYDYIIINITQSIFSLIFTSILIIYFGLSGALVALATNQSIVLIFTIFMLKKNGIINPSAFHSKFSPKIAKKLFSYSAMAIVSVILVPGSQIFIRNYITATQGADYAGYWQGMWYISTMYLMVITTALSTYYLPRLSEIHKFTEIKKEIINGYKILIPIVIGIGFLIYSLRGLIVNLLFSQQFTPMEQLFKWQVIGDIFKIASWLLAYLMVAKSMTFIYIISEITFTCTLIILSTIMIDSYGIIGATYAYAINYQLYLIFSFFIFLRLKWKNE